MVLSLTEREPLTTKSDLKDEIALVRPRLQLLSVILSAIQEIPKSCHLSPFRGLCGWYSA